MEADLFVAAAGQQYQITGSGIDTPLPLELINEAGVQLCIQPVEIPAFHQFLFAGLEQAETAALGQAVEFIYLAQAEGLLAGERNGIDGCHVDNRTTGKSAVTIAESPPPG